MRSFTGQGRTLYISPIMNPSVYSASWTCAMSPLAHLTCVCTWDPPGPSTFSPKSSAFSTHSLRVLTHSVFDSSGCLVNGHCFSKASTRCSYVSLSVFVRSANHGSAWDPYHRLTLNLFTICLSVVSPSLSIWASISLRNWPGSRFGSSSPSHVRDASWCDM